MKKRKNYGRKIKRSKINLYPKKKTKAQKILGTVLLIIVILAIVFLGYCLGKPLLEFIEKNAGQGDNTPAWTPPADTTAAEEIPETTTVPEETTTAAATTTPVPAEKPDVYSVSVPFSALSNSASLSTFASKAAAEGYTAAAVCMKDSSGTLFYNTQVEPVKDSEAVIASLTAEEISGILSRHGLTPIAYVSVLSDNMGGQINTDMCYKIVDEPTVSWLDYYSAEGKPLRWSDPKNEAAISYNKAITDELKAAGFEEIILMSVIFPPFQEYDREFIAAEYFAADRYKMLMNVVPEGTDIFVNAEDIILNNMTGSAEILKNKTDLKGHTIIINISRDPFTAEAGYPADASALLEDIMSQCKAKCIGLDISPMVTGGNFTEKEIEEMKAAAETAGYKDFYVK